MYLSSHNQIAPMLHVVKTLSLAKMLALFYNARCSINSSMVVVSFEIFCLMIHCIILLEATLLRTISTIQGIESSAGEL